MNPLSEEELKKELVKLEHWDVDNDHLVTVFEFENFAETMHFAQHVAELAEKHQHHPRMIIDYDLLGIELSTHDAGDKITQKDVDLAHAIDHLDKHHDEMH